MRHKSSKKVNAVALVNFPLSGGIFLTDMRFFLVFALFTGTFLLQFLPPPLWAEDGENFPPGKSARQVYVIKDVVYHLTGRTQQVVLEKRLEIKKGAAFSSEKELTAYLADRREILLSQRVLDKANLTYTLHSPTGEKDSVDDVGGAEYEVYVFVSAEDTANWIITPFFKYDSNSGLLLGLRFRDYNFFGSMEELKLNLDYLFGKKENGNELKQELAFLIPFRFLEHTWRLRTAEKLGYKMDGKTWKFDAETGLAVDFPQGERDWTLEYVQSYYYNDTDFYGDRYYTESKLLFGTGFDLPLQLGRIGSVKYRPDVFTRVKYRHNKDLSPERRGVEPGLSQTLFSRRIDWKDNFREGADLSLTIETAWNLRESRWKNTIDWAAIGHKAFPWLGLSSRLEGYFQFFQEKGPQFDDELGKPIRGILDDRLRGDAGLFLNIDIPVKMWTWFLDPYLEVHAGPFFDMALIRRKGEGFKPKDAYYSGGLQVMLFPRFSRSIFIRGFLGIDLEAFFDDHKLTGDAPRADANGKPWSRLEAYIGFGHHY
jgi:hypothetical protein